MNKITILFFATLRDLAGTRFSDMEIPDNMTVGELKKQLVKQFPGIEPSLSSVLVSINKQYAFDEDEIPDKAEIALFPPVSGGSEGECPTITLITDAPLNVNGLLESIAHPTVGAACVFTGMVRGITTGERNIETDHLEYEAYHSMAESKLRQVAAEIRDKWPAVKGIAIVQRIGILEPGIPTVVVACTAAHRGSGVFEATRYGIDRVKQIVPIWKKEVGVNGEEWVEGEYIPRRGER
jgi:molybdopterin synthase catalytic subunit